MFGHGRDIQRLLLFRNIFHTHVFLRITPSGYPKPLGWIMVHCSMQPIRADGNAQVGAEACGWISGEESVGWRRISWVLEWNVQCTYNIL